MGIERKASKSIAAHLLTMGICCRGAIEKEQRIDIYESEMENVIENSKEENKNGKYKV